MRTKFAPMSVEEHGMLKSVSSHSSSLATCSPSTQYDSSCSQLELGELSLLASPPQKLGALVRRQLEAVRARRRNQQRNTGGGVGTGDTGETAPA